MPSNVADTERDEEAYVRGWQRTMKCAGLLDFDAEDKASLAAGVASSAGTTAATAAANWPLSNIEDKARKKTWLDSENFVDKAVPQQRPDIAEEVLNSRADRRLVGADSAMQQLLDVSELEDIETLPGEKYQYSQPAKTVFQTGEDYFSLPKGLHEVGHARAFSDSPEWLQSIRHHASSGKGRLGGMMVGFGMGASDNETAQDWAPAVAAAGEAPELIEEARANLEADKLMGQLIDRGDMSPDALSRIRKALGAGMGKYVAGSSAVVGGIAAVPWLKDKFQTYFED